VDGVVGFSRTEVQRPGWDLASSAIASSSSLVAARGHAGHYEDNRNRAGAGVNTCLGLLFDRVEAQ
jgi:hypothetical protein